MRKTEAVQTPGRARVNHRLIPLGLAAALFLGSTCSLFNKPPSAPVISGPSAGIVGVPVEFTATATDPDGDSITYQFAWGDGDTSAWSALLASGESTVASHTFSDSGAYEVRAKARDGEGSESDLGAAHAIAVLGEGPGYPDSLVARVYVGGYTGTLALSADGDYLYVAHYADDQLLVMRTSDFAIVDTVPVGDWPCDMVRSPDGEFIYVTNLSSGDVSFVRTLDNVVVATVAVGMKPEGLDVSPDGTMLYVACREEDSVAVVSTGSREVVAKIPVGEGPCSVALTSDGTKAYVAERLDSTVAVVNTATYAVSGRVKFGDLVDVVAVNRDGISAYVGSRDGLVTVLSVADDTVVGAVDVGEKPVEIEVTSDGLYALVANHAYGILPVVRLALVAVVGQLECDGNLSSVCVSPDGKVAFAADDYRGVYVFE